MGKRSVNIEISIPVVCKKCGKNLVAEHYASDHFVKRDTQFGLIAVQPCENCNKTLTDALTAIFGKDFLQDLSCYDSEEMKGIYDIGGKR